MLTISSYNLLSTIACGEVTVHTLHAGVATQVGQQAADEILLSSLIQLCDSRLAAWSFSVAYGDRRATKKMEGGPIALLERWQEMFGLAGPRTQEPDPSTISLEATAKGHAELEKPSYKLYKPFLDAWAAKVPTA